MIVTVVILFLIMPLIGFQNMDQTDLCWEVIDEYDDMVEAAAPPVDVCWTGIE